MQTKLPKEPNTASRPWVTVLDKMIVLDLFKTLVSVWSIIVVIIVSRAFIRILDKAIDGQVSNDTLLTMLSLKTIVIGINLLPAAIFMAVLMVIGRLYKDHEMSAVASAGGGSGTIYHAVFLLALPLALLSAGLSLYVAPWAEASMEKLLHRDRQSAEIRGISAGKFSEYSHGDLVFYVEKIDAQKKMHSVFLQQRSKGQLGIINAKASRLVDLPSGRYMIFENGQRVQGLPGKVEHTIETFDEYAVQIEAKISTYGIPSQAHASTDLWRSTAPADIAELQRRYFIPLSILLLTFIAVPLTQMSPRAGVYGNIIVGFLIYFTYGNLARVSQAWVTSGTLSATLGAIGVNLLFLLIGGLLLARLYGWQWLWMNIRNKGQI